MPHDARHSRLRHAAQPDRNRQTYSGLTKIRTRRRAADSTNSTEPVRPVLGHLRESFSLS
ncbi:conserved hypothetical protein [Neisseria gonorrhoeae DGI2]|nr:conserved hypothetical protein [Neisseria gonorrhoeae DGI2]